MVRCLSVRIAMPALACGLVLMLNNCDCGSSASEESCKEQGLSYKETKEGMGYCFKKGGTVVEPTKIDCSTADEGTECNDADACTFNDACTGGTCVGTALTGIDDGNPCTEDRCDPVSGTISHLPEPANGEPCDDEDICSNNDSCNNGRCQGDYTVDRNGALIDDGDACTADSCDSTGQRQNIPYSAAEAAALGLGGITMADIANPCSQYECIVGQGQQPHMNVINNVDCSGPGRANGDCVNWLCQAGICTAIVDENAVQTVPLSDDPALHPSCRMRHCNTASGSVEYVLNPLSVGEPCNDHQSCTFADVCLPSGSCQGVELAHGTLCSDENACTETDYCHEGECTPGLDLLALANEIPGEPGQDPALDAYRDPSGIVAAADPCQQYICTDRGIVVAAASDGTQCDDLNPCTTSSSCQDGRCVGARDNTNDLFPCPSPSNECEMGICDKGVCVNFQPVSDMRSCSGDVCKVWRCEEQGGHGVCVSAGSVPNNPQIECGDYTGCQIGFCENGNCTLDVDYNEGQPCTGEPTPFDDRCNTGQCNSTGVCEVFPTAVGTPCTVTVEDLAAFGLPASGLACNSGECQGANRVCTPVPTNIDGSCDDGNSCNGEDWCQETPSPGGLRGVCQEKFLGDQPTGPGPNDSLCQNQTPDADCYDNATPNASGGTPCNVDGNPSTVGRCHYDGRCVEISRLVDDVNDCTVPVAWEGDVDNGQIAWENKANGEPCHLVTINPCVENLGTCIDGECHVNQMPDGAPCDLADQSVPAVEDLPAGHQQTCYAEICLAGQCVVDSNWQNGQVCDDGETVCTQSGTCVDGACSPSDNPRGYGETCTEVATAGIIDIDGNPIVAKDVQCWAVFECSETGTCNVAVAKLNNGLACDFAQDGDLCDGHCQDGICESHNWPNNATTAAYCEDGNPCTSGQCDASGGCTVTNLNGPQAGCLGDLPENICQFNVCDNGVCITDGHDNGPCDDGNPCTSGDRCTQGACVSTGSVPAGTACQFGQDFVDADCTALVCDGNGHCTDVDNEPQFSPCWPTPAPPTCSTYSCDSNGSCEFRSQRPDGANCDLNSQPCDEGCFDIDGDGPANSACLPFDSFEGLLTAQQMAADGSAGAENQATGIEELRCREQFDPTFDSTAAQPDESGHSCSRFICYFGACRPWDDKLPAELLASSDVNYSDPDSNPLGGNPRNAQSCGDSGECTNLGLCQDNICVSYHHNLDGELCSVPRCEDSGNMVYQPICEAGACTMTQDVIDSCSKGVATCQANFCQGGECPYDCEITNFDYVNVFEDISNDGGTPRSADLVSPLDTSVSCTAATNQALSEKRRLACDDGSVLLDLQSDLGFGSPDSDAEGFWFYNRRYRYISISANGTVLLHKDHPSALSETEETLFIQGNVGGASGNYNGENAAQIRVFGDDLTFVSDKNDDEPVDPDDTYGTFTTFGEIYTKHMPGPDGEATASSFDDYLIIQWHDAAFYGCAPSVNTRSHMTFQMKWWPATGMVVFVYPDDKGNSDAETLNSAHCLPGRIHGADAVIGLYDEGLAPAHEVGSNGWLIVNTSNSHPLADTFDGFFMFWPEDKPTTSYGWRTVEWFNDLSSYDLDKGATLGDVLPQVSDCNDCCERVEFEQPILVDGQVRTFMQVCADGYVHFMDHDHPMFNAFSENNEGRPMIDVNTPVFHAAPFWSDLRFEESSLSNIFWLDDNSSGDRRIIVQWHKADLDYQTGQDGFQPHEQETGEEMCSNDGHAGDPDDDGDGAVDCDDSSCSCAYICGGNGCGLTFQAIFHTELGFVEFRYQDAFKNYRYAESCTQTAIGVQQSRQPYNGIDLSDQRNGGDPPPPEPQLDPADMDEQRPGEQLNIILPLGGYLTPYKNVLSQ